MDAGSAGFWPIDSTALQADLGLGALAGLPAPRPGLAGNTQAPSGRPRGVGPAGSWWRSQGRRGARLDGVLRLPPALWLPWR